MVVVPATHADEWPGLASAALKPSGEPALELVVAVDDCELARLEHEVEVATVDRVLRPPAVDDAPFFADDGHRLAVHAARRPVEFFLDERRTRSI